MCKVDGCKRASNYIKQDVCQKHYFRMMRNGSYDLKDKSNKLELITPNGYRKLYLPEHPLSNSDGYLFEHRYVLFESIGFGEHKCEICGKPWNWNGKSDHVDHINKDKLDNLITNLRTLCNGCNSNRTKKTYKKESGYTEIAYLGVTKTAEAWSRESFVNVTGKTIRARIENGWSIKDALLTPSKTHKKLKELQNES